MNTAPGEYDVDGVKTEARRSRPIMMPELTTTGRRARPPGRAAAVANTATVPRIARVFSIGEMLPPTEVGQNTARTAAAMITPRRACSAHPGVAATMPISSDEG